MSRSSSSEPGGRSRSDIRRAGGGCDGDPKATDSQPRVVSERVNGLQRQDRAGHSGFGAGLGPYAPPTAPENAPNVPYVVWDDVGIATWDCFGGLVKMPAMTRIAERGVRLSQFHTTALCSPTRASLLTGRNATTVGMAMVEEFTEGFPGINGRIPNETALISEVLAERGWKHTASESGI